MSKELSELLSLFKEKKFSLAEKKCFKLIKKIKPNHEIFNIYAVILFELNNYDDAIKYWKKSIELNQKYFFGFNNLGNVYLKKNEFQTALKYYDKATEIKIDYFEAFHNKGNVFSKMNDLTNALKNYDKALKIKSDYLPSIKGKSDIYVKQKTFDKAILELEKILIYEPNNINSYIQKADILSQQNKFREAIDNYEIAYDLNPDHPFLLGDMIHAKAKICDWKNIDEKVKKLEKNILNKKESSPPFTASTLFDSPKLLYEVAKIWQAHFKIERKEEKKFIKTNKKKN